MDRRRYLALLERHIATFSMAAGTYGKWPHIHQEWLPTMTVPAKNSSRERDSELLVAISAGSRQALEELYLGYHRRLARFLSRFTPRYENVEEIINDTFMVVWQGAKDFRCASQVSTWIIGIAYRTALKSRRRHRRCAGEKPMNEQRGRLGCGQPAISALIPWYVNGSIDESERRRIDL